MKILTLAVTTAALIFTTTAPVAASPSASEGQEKSARVRVSLSTDTPVVRKGGTAELTGKVRGASGRSRVVIWQRNVSGSRWVVEARRTTTRTGRFTHREDVNTGSRQYRACVGGRCSKRLLVTMGKPPKEPKAATSLAVTSTSPTSIEAGQATTVSGTASRNLAGLRVYVQAYDAGSTTWGAIGSANVTADGTWAAAATVTTASRSVPLRVVFNGSKTLLGSAADAGAIAVFGWYYLYDFDPVAGGWTEGSYGISGVTYPKSVSDGDDYTYGEANLSRSCTRFVATIGLSDSSSTTSRYSTSVTADSVTLVRFNDLALGQAMPVDLSLVNALRLRLETTRVAGSTAAVVFGDARVLCAF